MYFLQSERPSFYTPYPYKKRENESTENFSLYILGQETEDKGFSTTCCEPRHFTNKLKSGLRVNRKNMYVHSL